MANQAVQNKVIENVKGKNSKVHFILNNGFRIEGRSWIMMIFVY